LINKLPDITNQLHEQWLLVRKNTPKHDYGNYPNNENGTVIDNITWLMWEQNMWEKITYEEAIEKANESDLWWYDDWRLPNAKELQSIVDYTKSPQTTNTPAIDNIFNTSKIIDPDWNDNYPFFWTSTTHLDWKIPESNWVYIAFWEAQWEMHWKLMDVHWVWAQRSDPKSGKISDFPTYFGSQGDVRYVYNYVRCVR